MDQIRFQPIFEGARPWFQQKIIEVPTMEMEQALKIESVGIEKNPALLADPLFAEIQLSRNTPIDARINIDLILDIAMVWY